MFDFYLKMIHPRGQEQLFRLFYIYSIHLNFSHPGKHWFTPWWTLWWYHNTDIWQRRGGERHREREREYTAAVRKYGLNSSYRLTLTVLQCNYVFQCHWISLSNAYRWHVAILSWLSKMAIKGYSFKFIAKWLTRLSVWRLGAIMEQRTECALILKCVSRWN